MSASRPPGALTISLVKSGLTGEWMDFKEICRRVPGVPPSAVRKSLNCLIASGAVERRDNLHVTRIWLYRLAPEASA